MYVNVHVCRTDANTDMKSEVSFKHGAKIFSNIRHTGVKCGYQPWVERQQIQPDKTIYMIHLKTKNCSGLTNKKQGKHFKKSLCTTFKEAQVIPILKKTTLDTANINSRSSHSYKKVIKVLFIMNSLIQNDLQQSYKSVSVTQELYAADAF